MKKDKGARVSGDVNVLNSTVSVPFDERVISYRTTGNGTGEIDTIIYKRSSATVATITCTYDSSNRLIDVVRT